ncbi:fatty acid desaturase family protein [Wenzhouxiangella limi]|nr:fatty acid desaturase [Wenzhouxiangella limi]
MNESEQKQWIRQAHAEVDDLFARSPAIYWTDLLISATVAWTATVAYFALPWGSPGQLIGLIVAGIAFYRAGTFMHEIIHMPRGELTWFKRAWNLLVGIPLLMPWILYRNHIEHHSRAHFGTPRDGEYLPLAAAPLRETFLYLLRIPILPLMALARFGLAGPLSRFSPSFREWLLSRGSAYASNPFYRKRFPEKERAHLETVEWLALAWVLFWLAMTVFGPVEPAHWLMAWLLHGWTMALNWVRNLAAHGYARRGETMSHLEQLEDSINITGQTWLTLWLFPVGLRYHALHHLFPGLPYHNMGQAHQRLMDRFGQNSPYAVANHDNYFRVVATLFSRAAAVRPAESAITNWRSGPAA